MTALISPVRGSSATSAACACGIGSVLPFLAFSRRHLSYFFARSKSTFFIPASTAAVASLHSALRVTVSGRIIIWRANNSREVGAFRQPQLSQILSEVGHAGFRESANAKAPAVAQVNFVGVQLEDLLLVEALLELDRNHGFGELPPPVAIGRQKERARHLHRNGAGALIVLAAVPHVGPRGPHDADEG